MKNYKGPAFGALAVVIILLAIFSFSNGSFLQGKIQASKVAAKLSIVQPVAKTLGAGMEHVKVGSFDISANAKVNVKELYINMSGVVEPKVIEGVSLETGGNLLSSLDGGKLKYEFKNVEFAIGGGETKQLDLFVDTADSIDSTGTFQFLLRGIKFMDANTGDINSKGFNNLKGPSMAITTYDCSNGGC